MTKPDVCSVDDCEKPRAKMTWCEMHYWRQHRHGVEGLLANGRQAPAPPPEERILKDSNGCWIWQGPQDRNGYGRVTLKRKSRSTHRWFYEKYVGPIPDGLQIDHLCRVRLCVNPQHLEPVTLRENLARSTHPVRFAILFNTCHRGHPLVEGNVYVSPSRPNCRNCRTCRRELDKAKRERKEAATPQEPRGAA